MLVAVVTVWLRANWGIVKGIRTEHTRSRVSKTLEFTKTVRYSAEQEYAQIHFVTRNKVIPTEEARTSMFQLMLGNMFAACKADGIPVPLIAPANLSDKAKKLLGDIGPNIHIVSPEELEAQIRKYL